MTNEEKQLLIKDICARLPYGVFVKESDVNDRVIYTYDYHPHIETCKSYLRPMSSMTDEEKEDLKKNYRFYFDDCDDGITNGIYSHQFNRTIYEMIDEYDISGIIDWLNSHHFDYRWLIEKGLALEAPEGMYKIKSL
jgi:hypothetical protein